MKKLLLFATTMLLAFSGIELCAAKESANANESTAEAVAAAGPKVYSNCYDGYLNVRAQPTTSRRSWQDSTTALMVLSFLVLRVAGARCV